MNVYQMYVAHGGAGFWVSRTTWGKTCARVVKVGEMTAPGPYFGNPTVLMDVYTLAGQMKNGAAQLPVPGTYKTWREIDPPEWASSIQLRPLDDPALDAALPHVDDKGQKRHSTTKSERVWLKVPYERNMEVKKLGARWAPTAKAWWLPSGDAAAVAEAQRLGFLPDTDDLSPENVLDLG